MKKYAKACWLLCGLFIFLTSPAPAFAFQLPSSTTFNGSGNGYDEGYGIATDSSGNVWIAGWVNGPSKDIWVAKYNSSLVLQASATFNGSANNVDTGYGIATDSSGNVWVTGSLLNVGSEFDNIWVAKYNSSLVLQASATINGSSNSSDRGQGITTDSSGNVWVTGQIDENTGDNIWVAKYNSSLVLQASATINGSGIAFDQGTGITTDSSDNVWVTGSVNETSEADNIWIAKYNSSLVLQASATINGSGNTNDSGQGITTDSSGNVWVTGSVNETSEGSNIWVAKYNSSLVLQASATINGSGNTNDYGTGIARDSSGNVWVTGWVFETSGDNNILVAQYNSLLVLQASATFNGSLDNVDRGYGIAADSSGNVWVTGGLSELSGGTNIWLGKFAALPCSAITSAGSGTWSDPATWSSATMPAGCNAVTIAAGHTVTVDITTATASTTTINGTLTFSRATSSKFTLTAGNITVQPGGTIDMGTEASPIPTAIQATLILAPGEILTPLGLIVNNGGNYTVRGATKTPYGIAGTDAFTGATSLSIPGPGTIGWAVGDTITIGGTERLPLDLGHANETEERAITGISGSDPKTISWSGGLTYNHYSTGPLVVSNLTRNVQIQSSYPYAEIQNLALNTTSFYLAHGEVVGVKIINRASGIVSSSTFHDVAWISLEGASSSTISGNIFVSVASGVRLTSSSFNTINGNVQHAPASGSGGFAFQLVDSWQNTLTSNYSFSKSFGIFMKESSSNTLNSNKIYANSGRGIYISETSSGNTIVSNEVYNNRTGGIHLVRSDNNKVLANNIHSNGSSGLSLLECSHNQLDSNNVYWNGGGIYLSSSSNNNIVTSNNVYGHSGSSAYGIAISYASSNTFAFNQSYGNGGNGSRLCYITVKPCNNNLLVSNRFHSNQESGIYLGAYFDFNTLVDNYSYSNSGSGVRFSGESNTLVGGALGFDAVGTALPNGYAEVLRDNRSLTMKETRVNPTAGLATNTFAFDLQESYLLSYNQEYDTGTIRIHGDYLVSGRTLTLDYATQLYASTATSPNMMWGNSISAATVNSTNDDNAVSQLVTITYDASDSLWHIAGSVSGEMGTLPSSGGTADFPSSSPQFNLSLAASGAEDSDRADLVLIAASQDAGVQKKLLFGDADLSFNQGRSRLTVAADGGIVLRGVQGTPTIMDRLDSSSTYYTFVDSGAFTAEHAFITNMDPTGIQLSGSAGVTLASSTFDFAGQGNSSTSAYITVRNLTSAATFYGLVFNNSRSNTYLYNVRVDGSDTGLNWDMKSWSGPRAGEEYDDESNERIRWGPATPSSFLGTVLGVSSITWAWADVEWEEGFRIVSSTGGNLSGDLAINAPTWTETGLSTNTAYNRRVVAFSVDNVSTSTALTKYTLAAPPIGLTAVEVNITSFTLSWDSNTNPSSTRFELSMSTDDFITAFSTPVPLSAALTATTTALLNLASDTTYYFRVRAYNGDNAPTGFTTTASTMTRPPVPGQPGKPVGTVLGVSSISWTWASATDVATYRVFQESSPATLIGSVAAPNFIQLGLSPPNTTSSILVDAVNVSGIGNLSSSGTAVYTLAALPTGTASSDVKETSATVTWGLNGNPAYTLAELERSTDNATFSQVFTGAQTTFIDYQLLGCTTYYFRVRNNNGAGIPTGYDNAIQLLTLGPTPPPPGSLSAESLAGLRIRLTWNPAPFEGITQYRLYYNSGAGAIDYGTPLAVFSSSVTAYTTTALVSGTPYLFGLRAAHRCGIEETNTQVRAMATALQSLSGVRARIKVPQSGKRITGNRVTIVAELVGGDPGQTREIAFQFKASTATVWTTITPPPEDLNHPNPDTVFPYFIHWDVMSLGTTEYDLRAVATDIFGNTDPAAAAITVTHDSVNFDINETSLGNGRVEKKQKVHNIVDNTVSASDGGTSQVTEVVIPAGALDESTMTVTVVNRPPDAPANPTDLQAVGIVAKITLSNSQSQLAGGKRATVVLSFPDDNNDGIVDGTAVRADDLAIFVHDPGSGKWIKEFGSTVDRANKTITGSTPHFSFFAAFVPAHADLSALRVYPNPFRPNNGDSEDGTAFSAGNANSGIIFDQLPDNVTIRIFTLIGQLVAEETSATGGRIQWDARNDRGRDVASGLYFAVIKSAGQETVVRKILVIR